jgi:hypothetical protein
VSFSVRLTADLVAVEAGATVPLGVEISNKGGADRFEMQVEGLDPEWTAVPEPVFSVEADEIHGEKVFLKPAREPNSIAGNYPFVIRVRSLESGESRAVQGVLQIKPYHHLSMEINPKKGHISPTKANNIFGITLMNLGNVEHTFQLFGSDPEDGCSFDFQENQVTVGPGQQRLVEVAVDAQRQRIVSGVRLYGFSISARSTTVPQVNGSVQAQLEQRPLLTVGVSIFLGLLLVLLAAWYAMLPKPATLRLWVERATVTRGEPIVLNWVVENATGLTLKYNGETVTVQNLRGKQEIPTDALSGTITIEGTVERDGKYSVQKEVVVAVRVPDPAPDPKILEFAVDKTEAPLGSSFVFKYKFSPSVTKAYLEPLKDPLALELNSIQVEADSKGKLTYTLVAQNADGKIVRSEKTVFVFEKSIAAILDFSASSIQLDEPNQRVVFRWQASKAERLTIASGVTRPAIFTGADAIQGEYEVAVPRSATFTLTAYDDRGLAVSKSIRINVTQPPKIEPDPSSTGDGITSPPGGTGAEPPLPSTGNPPPR